MTSIIVCTSPWGRLKVGNRYVWVSFHEYCGPSFYTDSAMNKLYDPKDENDPVWEQFDRWLKKYRAAKDKEQSARIVGVPASPATEEWNEASRIRDLPEVDEAIRNMLEDQTGDNSTCMVREVLRAARGAEEPFTPAHTCANAGTSAGACKTHCGDKVRCWGTDGG